MEADAAIVEECLADLVASVAAARAGAGDAVTHARGLLMRYASIVFAAGSSGHGHSRSSVASGRAPA
jgi:hypothetical protein